MSDNFTGDPHSGVRLIGDVAAGAVTALTFVNVLPAIAAVFAIGWYFIGYYEKTTGKAFSKSWLARLLRWDWA
jgi:hypothetical protein